MKKKGSDSSDAVFRENRKPALDGRIYIPIHMRSLQKDNNNANGIHGSY